MASSSLPGTIRWTMSPNKPLVSIPKYKDAQVLTRNTWNCLLFWIAYNWQLCIFCSQDLLFTHGSPYPSHPQKSMKHRTYHQLMSKIVDGASILIA